MTDQYQVPEDITLEEKIDYLTSSLQIELHNRWNNTKSIEVFKALMHTYDPIEDKTLKETNDKALANSERMLLRGQILISKWQNELAPLLEEKKLKDEKAETAKSAPAQIAATEGTEPAPNGKRATVKENI